MSLIPRRVIKRKSFSRLRSKYQRGSLKKMKSYFLVVNMTLSINPGKWKKRVWGRGGSGTGHPYLLPPAHFISSLPFASSPFPSSSPFAPLPYLLPASSLLGAQSFCSITFCPLPPPHCPSLYSLWAVVSVWHNEIQGFNKFSIEFFAMQSIVFIVNSYISSV